jgi:hypothetical protein
VLTVRAMAACVEALQDASRPRTRPEAAV